MKVLFLEKNMTDASPLITLADSLKERNVDIFFADFSKLTTMSLIKLYLKVDVVVLQHYAELQGYDARQVSLASLLGAPLVRNWAGTDALNSTSNDIIKYSTSLVDSFTAANVTTTHSGLVDELASIGLRCDLLPQIVEFKLINSTDKNTFKPKSALVYLPSAKMQFYGSEYIERLIHNYPEMHFTIIADHEHYFEKYDNVTSLGWVDKVEMLNVWDNIGLLIRITEHDGFPRMILEALGRGKYVIHNNENIEGIWYAHDQESIEVELERYLSKSEENYKGLHVFENLKQDNPGKRYYDYLSSVKNPFKKRLSALRYLLQSLI